ncbi:MAG: hypothetical protein GY926_14585 [bacterium]|nr:hypothetical protein [bacterium]
MRNRLIATATVFVLLVAACGGDSADEGTTTSSAAAETTMTVAPAATTSTVPAPTTTTSAPTTTTEPPAAIPPAGAMLITNEDGVFVATVDGVVSHVVAADPGAVGGILDFAVDDTRGGLIVQPHRNPWFFLGNDSIIYWVPQGSSTLQELLVPAADQGLKLEDTATQGGSTHIYYTRRSGDLPDTAEQTLRRFDLDAKTVDEVSVVGGWESGTSPISVGGNSIVRNGAGEAYFFLVFTDLGGEVFESPANSIPDGGFDCVPFECFWYADLSPDGTEVALGRLAPNAGGFPTIPEIEVRDVASGDLIISVTLPEVPAVAGIDSLDLDDDYVLINLIEEGAVYPYATVVDIASGGMTTFPAPVGGIARFLRSVPDLDGVVAWP